ncbi:hypothetical protein [Methylocystis sp.]|uniref:hypothetical protein n=1 Tax=Methylocystis sp. TaxID=1911079 RepID=UPI0025CE3717|nr:hypothetical protein [Methylocystis sp.]
MSVFFSRRPRRLFGRRGAWRAAIKAARRVDGTPERGFEANDGNQANDGHAGDCDYSSGAARAPLADSRRFAKADERANGSRRNIVTGAGLAVRRCALHRQADVVCGDKSAHGRGFGLGARRVASNSQNFGFFRSGANLSSPLFLLMTLKALDEPIVDENFPACRILAIAGGGLMTRRFCELFRLPAPECFGDPIIARHVRRGTRFDRFGVALTRGALAQ